MARRRRRRPDGSELDELEEDEDLDVRVTSVEEEIQNLTVNTMTQTQQLTALRVKLDKLAREMEEGHDGDDELFQELDGLKTGLHSAQSQLSEAQQNLANRLSQVQLRLDQIGEHGALEELPGRIQRTLIVALTDLESKLDQRLRSIEQAREEEGDLVLTRLEEFNLHLDDALNAASTANKAQFQEFGEQIRGEIAEIKRTNATLSQDLGSRFETLASEVERNLSEIESGFQGSLDAQAKEQAQSRQNFTSAIDELASLLDERASHEDLARVKQQFAEVTAKLDVAGGVEERSKAAVAEVQKLESMLREQGEKIKTLAEQNAKSLAEVEKHQDKVSIAIKLVDALSDRARGGGGAETGGASSFGSTVADHELEAPDKTELGFEIKDLIGVMVTHQATDLHLKVDSPPTVRLRGELIPVGNHILGEEDCRRLVFSTLTKPQRRTLLEKKHIEFLCEIQGARMRALAFVQRGRLSASFKVLQRALPGLEELGLPSALKRLVSSIQSGLLLVAGPTGSGKSTTLAALVEHLNQTRKIHIVTLEKPVEYIHQDQQSLITQREIGTDSENFAAGLREALRMDPDVILVDKLDNPDTVALALAAADSGHVILAGVDTLTAVQTLDYLRTSLSRPGQPTSLTQLSSCLRGIVCQKLLPRADRKGMVVNTEVLLNNPAVSQCIVEGTLDRINGIIKASQAEGMRSFGQSLQKLAEAALITNEDAALYGGQPVSSSARQTTPAPTAAPTQSAPATPPPPPTTNPNSPSSQPPPPAVAGGDDTIMGWL